MLTLTSRSSRRSEKAGNGDEDRRGGSARASEPQGTALLRGAGTAGVGADLGGAEGVSGICRRAGSAHSAVRSEEHKSELHSLMRISYAVFCLKKKNKK